MSAVLTYLRLMVFPVNLNADYEQRLTAVFGLWTAIGISVIAAGSYMLYRLRKEMPEVSFFGFWFLITLAPESSFFPLPDIIVEYRLYLPLAGFVTAVVLYLSRMDMNRKAVAAATICTLVAFSVMTFERNKVWKNAYTLWRDVEKKAPGNYRGHTGLGEYYFGEGRSGDAVTEFREAIRLRPDRNINTYANLGLAYLSLGRLGEAADILENAESREGCTAQVHANLGMTYIQQGKNDIGIQELEAAIADKPDNFNINLFVSMGYRDAGLMDKAAYYGNKAVACADSEEKRAAAVSNLSDIEKQAAGSARQTGNLQPK